MVSSAEGAEGSATHTMVDTSAEAGAVKRGKLAMLGTLDRQKNDHQRQLRRVSVCVW